MPARAITVTPLRTRTSQVQASHKQPAPKREPFPLQEPQAVQNLQPVQNRVPIQNRVPVLLVHIPRLSIRGQARLAAEVGVSRSTISRLVSGRINPSYRLARGVTDALERLLGKPLDMREVFSTDGTYLTASGCALCRCNGCLPEEAFDADGNLKTEWQSARPGNWSLARPAVPPPVSDAMDEAGTEGE